MPFGTAFARRARLRLRAFCPSGCACFRLPAWLRSPCGFACPHDRALCVQSSCGAFRATPIMQAFASRLKKCTCLPEFWHKNRGVPRRESELGGAFDLEALVTWDFLLKVARLLAATSWIGRSFVGYLGFCGRIGPWRCTFLGSIALEQGDTRARSPAVGREKSPRGCGGCANRGGEVGIRTLDALLGHTHLAGEHLRPLGHFSTYNRCGLL